MRPLNGGMNRGEIVEMILDEEEMGFKGEWIDLSFRA
jgi:hypothetical protein